MKRIVIVFGLALLALATAAQTYPEPEFSNEVYFLKKDSVYSLMRLEKNSSKMETKTKLGGFGGSESGYTFDGQKSSVRFSGKTNFYFVISNGASDKSASSAKSDSTMRANGVDPSMMSGMMGGMTDPANSITLYKVESEKGVRKILFQKMGGANPFANHKMQSSDKYTFSVKKIRDGYWVLIVDKVLPSGEYAFSMSAMGMGAMTGTVVFAFGVD